MLLNKKLIWFFLIIAFLGFFDSTYLAIEHFRGVTPPCTIVEGCEEVTTSKYSTIFGVPVAFLGSFYYFAVFGLSVLYLQFKRDKFLIWASYLAILGFLASLGFVYLQLFVIEAVCVYCMFSALTSTILCGLGFYFRIKLSKNFAEWNTRLY